MVPQFCPQALAPQTAPCGHLVPAYPIPDYAALHSLLPILGHQTSLVLGFNLLQMLCAAVQLLFILQFADFITLMSILPLYKGEK
jgi:hypothetical protein